MSKIGISIPRQTAVSVSRRTPVSTGLCGSEWLLVRCPRAFVPPVISAALTTLNHSLGKFSFIWKKTRLVCLKQTGKVCVERQPRCCESCGFFGTPKIPWGLQGRVMWTLLSSLLWVGLARRPHGEAIFNPLCPGWGCEGLWKAWSALHKDGTVCQYLSSVCCGESVLSSLDASSSYREMLEDLQRAGVATTFLPLKEWVLTHSAWSIF